MLKVFCDVIHAVCAKIDSSVEILSGSGVDSLKDS